MKDKERKNRFNKEVSELKCNEQLGCANCEDITGFYLGTNCPDCLRPFRKVRTT